MSADDYHGGLFEKRYADGLMMTPYLKGFMTDPAFLKFTEDELIAHFAEKKAAMLSKGNVSEGRMISFGYRRERLLALKRRMNGTAPVFPIVYVGIREKDLGTMAFRKMVTEIVEQWSTKVDLQFLADKKGNKVRGALLYVHGTRGDSHRLEKHIQKTEVLWADAMPSGHEFPESHTMRPYGPLRKAKDKAA